MNHKIFISSNPNVQKFVFEGEGVAVEAVLYKYPTFKERTVICCSTQCGCPVGCHFCLPKDTKVLMSNFTYKNIQDVVIGDKVIANVLTKASNGYSDYASKYFKTSEVLDTQISKGPNKLYTLFTNSGRQISLTEGHTIACKRKSHDIYRIKYHKVQDVRIGDDVIITNHISDNPSNHEWRFGWLVGFIHGDGVYSKRKNKSCYRWSISQSDKAIIEFAKSVCEEFNIRACDVWEQYSDISERVNYRFEICDEGIRVLNEKISNLKDSECYKIGYVAGFWDSEGYSFRNNKSAIVCNANMDFIHNITQYLSELGFEKEVNVRTDVKGEDNLQPIHILNTKIPRNKFLSFFTPLHNKKEYLHTTKTKSLSKLDTIVDIVETNYDECVYNLTTTEHTYIANDVVVHNCGTGKFYVRSLSTAEIVEQVDTILSTIDCDPSEIQKFQIMFMSMGEPVLNGYNLCKAIEQLNIKYPNASLLISTSAPDTSDAKYEAILNLAEKIDKVGLQVSVHESTDENRAKLIPTRTLSLKRIGELGEEFARRTGRQPFFNYCVHENNSSDQDVENLSNLLNPDVWQCTLSVICEKDETMGESLDRQLDIISNFRDKLANVGYGIRVFNPAGQDMGNGCGQLWYFQKWAKDNKHLIK